MAKTSDLSMATARIEKVEDGSYALIFSKADNSKTKRTEVGIRLSRNALVSLLLDSIKLLA